MYTNIKDIEKWYREGTTIVHTYDASENRFVGIPTSIVGKLDCLPGEYGEVTIDGKKYPGGYIKEYSERDAQIAEEMGKIFFEELQKEIDREVIQSIINEAWQQ
jgi:hypothetical protein